MIFSDLLVSLGCISSGPAMCSRYSMSITTMTLPTGNFDLTTAAALQVLMADPGGLKALMRDAVAAAKRRAKELAG
jgi:pyrroline-5-carboxylate reductase